MTAHAMPRCSLIHRGVADRLLVFAEEKAAAAADGEEAGGAVDGVVVDKKTGMGKGSSWGRQLVEMQRAQLVRHLKAAAV